MRIDIKPMTVNHAWRGGRRYKTDEYKVFEKELCYRLPALALPEGRLAITLEFGVSNANFDWDNPIKPFVDVLQNRYQFNDNRIYQAQVKKTIVKKGEEFIDFEISALEEA